MLLFTLQLRSITPYYVEICFPHPKVTTQSQMARFKPWDGGACVPRILKISLRHASKTLAKVKKTERLMCLLAVPMPVQVTVMFLDIENFTELVESFNDTGVIQFYGDIMTVLTHGQRCLPPSLLLQWSIASSFH